MKNRWIDRELSHPVCIAAAASIGGVIGACWIAIVMMAVMP